MRRRWMRRSNGRRNVRSPATARSRFGPSPISKIFSVPERRVCRRSVSDAHRTIEAVARRSYGRLVSYLAARFRDVAAAEDALSEAMMAALRTWPEGGVPSNPEGWLLQAAKRKLIDRYRQDRVRDA